LRGKHEFVGSFEVAHVAGDEQLGLELASRPDGDAQKPCEVSSAGASAAFGNIGWN
jgi:hypothetical protein